MEEIKSQSGGKADPEFMELWDFYSPLLTEKQKRLTATVNRFLLYKK